jgi:hypothetical protein
MDHERYDAAPLESAELVGSHPQIGHVVGQELARRGQEQCKASGEHEAGRCDHEERPAITDYQFEQSAILRSRPAAHGNILP